MENREKLVCENCGSDKKVEDFGRHFIIRILCEDCANKPMIDMKVNFKPFKTTATLNPKFNQQN